MRDDMAMIHGMTDLTSTIQSTIAARMASCMPFTAYDITVAIRATGVRVGHNQVRDAVHDYMRQQTGWSGVHTPMQVNGQAVSPILYSPDAVRRPTRTAHDAVCTSARLSISATMLRQLGIGFKQDVRMLVVAQGQPDAHLSIVTVGACQDPLAIPLTTTRRGQLQIRQAHLIQLLGRTAPVQHWHIHVQANPDPTISMPIGITLTPS